MNERHPRRGLPARGRPRFTAGLPSALTLALLALVSSPVLAQTAAQTAAQPPTAAPPPAPATAPADSPPPGYVRCAYQAQVCSFNGTAQVVYGAGGTWTVPRSFNGGAACTNAVFGDPLPGVAKSCHYQAAGSRFELGLTLAGNGSVAFSDGSACAASCAKGFAGGVSVTLVASPSAGHTFAGWGGACQGTATCTVTMNAAKGVSAAFKPKLGG